MQGRVAVLREYGGEFELREYPVPEVEPGAILVKLTRAGVCGSDLHIWRGEMKDVYGTAPKDLTFGHEMCGHVERLGAGVTTDSNGQPLQEGDRITFAYFFPCGRCPVCLQDELGSCPRKARANGSPAHHPISITPTAIITTCVPTTMSINSRMKSRRYRHTGELCPVTSLVWVAARRSTFRSDGGHSGGRWPGAQCRRRRQGYGCRQSHRHRPDPWPS